MTEWRVVGHVRELWRYPVVGLMGERVEEARFTELGVAGDRRYALVDEETGEVLEPLAKKNGWGATKGISSTLLFSASYANGEESAPSIEFPDGEVISSVELVETKLEELLGRRLKLLEVSWLMREKASKGRAIHLLTTSSLESLRKLRPASDFRVERFRPNVLIETEGEGFVEEGWVGALLKLGDEVFLRVEKFNERCAVTTLAQSSLPEDPEVLRTIAKFNGNRLGVMCSVVTGGLVKRGDEVLLAKEGPKRI